MRSLVLGSALIVTLVACGGPRPAPPPENTGLGAITAITMQKTSCNGVCPAYTVQFLADGRARYDGGRDAALQGRFSGVIDFAPIAAWVATQHPETLPDAYPNAMTDAPAVNVEIDFGARRVRFTGVSESAASLRLEGILLALDGAASRVRWRRDDAATAFLGTFRSNAVTVTLHVDQSSDGRFLAYSTPTRCGAYPGYRLTLERGRMRLRCAGLTSVLRIAGDDLQAEGDALPPGRYARISPYAAYRDIRMDSRTRPPG